MAKGIGETDQAKVDLMVVQLAQHGPARWTLGQARPLLSCGENCLMDLDPHVIAELIEERLINYETKIMTGRSITVEISLSDKGVQRFLDQYPSVKPMLKLQVSDAIDG